MSVKLPNKIPEDSEWYSIDLGGGQSFELELRRPTFAEQVASLAATSPASQMKARLAAMVVDWRGVIDEQEPPQPVHYSMEALERLVAAYPQSFPQVNRALLELFFTYPGDLEKNSPPPPVNGGTTPPAVTDSSTMHSTSGRSSASASACEASSVT